MTFDLIPFDDFDRFQHRLRMRDINKRLPKQSWVRELRSRDYVYKKPYTLIKPDDLPLEKFLAQRAAKKLLQP